MKPRLADLDLSPMGETIINLLHEGTPETWGPWTTHSARMANWTPELGARAKAAHEESRGALRRSTIAERMAFLAAHGVVPATESRMSLTIAVEEVIEQARWPRRFINAKAAPVAAAAE